MVMLARTINADVKNVSKIENMGERHMSYLETFRKVAETPARTRLTVHSAPWSWLPLLGYLGANVKSPILHFKHDRLVRSAFRESKDLFTDRTVVEALSAFRPECVEALYHCDINPGWAVKRGGRVLPATKRDMEFIVSNASSYQRPEVLDHMVSLAQWKPTLQKVLLAPLHVCAAQHFIKVPTDWYVLGVSDVFGLVPTTLIPTLPRIGPPAPGNDWRICNAVRVYFEKWHAERIVVYDDVNTTAIKIGLKAVGVDAYFVNFVYQDPAQYFGGIDLLEPGRLRHLEAVLTATKI